VTSIIGTADPTSYPTPAVSLARLFYDRVEAMPDAEAYRFLVDEAWQSVTWRQTKEAVKTIAAGLLALGVQPEDRVAIASATRYKWLLADLAIICAGAATTAIYPSSRSEDFVFILNDSGSRIVFAEDDAQLAKLHAHRAELAGVEHVVTFDGHTDGDWVISLDDLQALGAKHLVAFPDIVDETVSAVRSDQLATLVYTSGTTGVPKGVELPHRCWTYVGAAASTLGILRSDDLQYLWLPLSHSFGKMLLAAQLQIGFSSAVDGRVDKIVDNLAEVRPTFLAGPPRIFEKVHAKVVQTVQEEGGVKARLFGWAFGVGARVSAAQLRGEQPGLLLRAQHVVADRLVLAKIRHLLGGRIRFLVSGSAALSPDVAGWFHAAGVLVLEGYGLTETSAAGCIIHPDDPAFGVVGPPVAGTEVRLAPDGEVFFRGPSVMRGYHNNPEATAEVLDAEGWFATGDVGELDATGKLRLTDRKKDLIKTSGGKYIAPQVIETTFRAICPLAGQMVVHGDSKNYATALVTLDPDALAQWCRARGIPDAAYATLAANASVQEYVHACVDELNGRLNRWETIKDFRILDHDLTVEADELTPSMKVKRRVVENRHQHLIDEMYADPALR
jgi:long-chain acyl-CoA synthetase